VKRVFITLVALVATPFVAGVSQARTNPGLGHDAAHCAMRASLHPGTDINKCDPPPVVQPPPPPPAPAPAPPPPPPPAPTSTCSVTAQSTSGTLSIDGTVALGVSPWTALPNWCIQLTGTVSATTLTDASGNYTFTGLPDGTYTVCEVVQSGWQQTFPGSGDTCPTGFGWTFTLVGYSGSFVNFKNTPMP
jgi:SdrD B-like domain